MSNSRRSYSSISALLSLGTPSGAPTNISTASGDKPTSQMLRWDPPVTALRNGLITQYTVLFHRRDDPLYVNEVNVTETEVVLENLQSDAVYVFTVKAHTAMGAGPWYVLSVVLSVTQGRFCYWHVQFT